LDCIKIKREERIRAIRLAKSAAGVALESDIQKQITNGISSSSTVKTFTPGESVDGTTVLTLFSVEEKEAIRNLLANAESVQQVEEIESAVRKGILPDQIRIQQEQQKQKRLNGNDENTSNGIDPPASKRLKVT
jgi:hypothetical protein